ncbi:type II secretion system protein GspL [Janthinobacterium fluminis]|uniref:Type II secretion system protein GspL n=1 Tax=Janthinobacterium fluminis TaxID=2987524 RepID=A0ABT5K6Q8_9BURK|nr:type II secretion system protein GspL [Janthinobacterium fluminis]MDC8760461.1 type II secretion system protein GspL [Janthinobacterium fluminis]
MTTLYIRHPAKASVDSVAQCQFALAGADGRLLQQGAAALGGMGQMIGAARRVVLLLAAADVTLLRLKVPPLSAARLKAALPGLVEEQILGEPGDCVLAAGAEGADGMRTVAVVQRAWLEVLVKALLAQGARGVAALPAQLCLPLQPGGAAAALHEVDGGVALTLRLAPHEGMGLILPAQAPATLLPLLRAFVAEAPLTLYVGAAQLAAYQEAAAATAGVAVEAEQWPHWIAAAKTAGLDLVPALGAAGGQARNWQRWRWPLRLALLVALVNIAGVNIEWLRLKRDAAALRAAMQQTFKAAYPNETPLYPAEQMRRNLATAKLASGQMAADEFSALGAALGEALGALGAKGAIASLDYRERALTVKLKPDTVPAGVLAKAKAALAERQLQLSEPAPGTWQIRAAAGVKP